MINNISNESDKKKQMQILRYKDKEFTPLKSYEVGFNCQIIL